jgi:cell wall assembly regulator SMI1
LYPPATAADVRRAEERIEFLFPPSMRQCLAVSNGMRISYGATYGVTTEGMRTTAARETVEWNTELWREGARKTARRRERRGLPPEIGIVGPAIAVVAGQGTGDRYVLLDEHRDGASGECPVGLVDHETSRLMGVVASNYERFMWFFIDEISRQVRPCGELILDEEEIPPSDWPFENKDWMLTHDPELARWI